MKTQEELEELFKEHIAIIKNEENITQLVFAKPNTGLYKMVYTFTGNMLFVHGDLGCATYWLTWKSTPKSFNDVDLYYFASKLECISEGKYIYSEERAIQELEERFLDSEEHYDLRDRIESLEQEIEYAKDEVADLTDSDEIDNINDFISSNLKEIKNINDEINNSEVAVLFNDLKSIARSVSSTSEFAFNINGDFDLLDRLEKYDCSYWEWLFSIGETINPRVQLHLEGIKAANKYLEQHDKEICA